MSTEHWIMVYLFVNGVLCYIGSSFDDYEDGFVKGTLIGVLAAAFALPIVVINYGWHGLKAVSKWLDGLIQFRTYWRYVFCRRRLIVEDVDTIEDVYKWGLKNMAGSSIRHRLFRHAQRLVHRVNNYTPTP